MATRGRPAVFVGARARRLVSLVRRYGLTGTVNYLKTNQLTFGKNGVPETVTISMPTLAKLATAAGIELQRGRPVTKRVRGANPVVVAETALDAALEAAA